MYKDLELLCQGFPNFRVQVWTLSYVSLCTFTWFWLQIYLHLKLCFFLKISLDLIWLSRYICKPALICFSTKVYLVPSPGILKPGLIFLILVFPDFSYMCSWCNISPDPISRYTLTFSYIYQVWLQVYMIPWSNVYLVLTLGIYNNLEQCLPGPDFRYIW